MTIGPHLVGHVAVTNVTAVPALSPRIRFGLSWTLGHRHRSGEASPPGDEYRLIDFEGELRVGADDLFVGTLVRDGSRHPLRSLDHVQTQEGFVALDLDGHRLERLDGRPCPEPANSFRSFLDPGAPPPLGRGESPGGRVSPHRFRGRVAGRSRRPVRWHPRAGDQGTRSVRSTTCRPKKASLPSI